MEGSCQQAMVVKGVQSLGETVFLQGIRVKQIADFSTLRTLIGLAGNYLTRLDEELLFCQATS